MSIKKISKEQPDNFEFNSKNLSNAKKIIEKVFQLHSYTVLFRYNKNK